MIGVKRFRKKCSPANVIWIASIRGKNDWQVQEMLMVDDDDAAAGQQGRTECTV